MSDNSRSESTSSPRSSGQPNRKRKQQNGTANRFNKYVDPQQHRIQQFFYRFIDT